MNTAIISTSINPRPKAYEAWAKLGTLYVAGDLNSPNELFEYVKDLGGRYLKPEHQEDWACSEAIGWRNIQRRNIALLEAMDDDGYDVIITVDDDNQPVDTDTFMGLVAQRFWFGTHAVSRVVTDGMWFNPGRMGRPVFRQRGLPANYHDRNSPFRTVYANDDTGIGVIQCAILGDPDTDAVQRIVDPVNVTSYDMDVYPEPGVYAPFNSQATIWPIKYAPLMAVLPYCKRYDDIYGSLIAQRIMHHFNDVVVFGQPYVFQDRNPHDLGKDLIAEVTGMNNVDGMVKLLSNTKLDGDDIIEHYQTLTRALVEEGYLTMSAYGFVSPYLADVKTTGWKA